MSSTPTEAREAGARWAARLEVASRVLTDPGFDLRQPLEPLGFRFAAPEEGEVPGEALPLDCLLDRAARCELRGLFLAWLAGAFAELAELLTAPGQAFVRRQVDHLGDDALLPDAPGADPGASPRGVSRLSELLEQVHGHTLIGSTPRAFAFAESFLSFRLPQVPALPHVVAAPPLPPELERARAEAPPAPLAPREDFQPLYDLLAEALSQPRAPRGSPAAGSSIGESPLDRLAREIVSSKESGATAGQILHGIELTNRELTEYFHVSPKTLQRWRKERRFPPLGQAKLTRLEDVIAWVEAERPQERPDPSRLPARVIQQATTAQHRLEDAQRSEP